MNERIEDLVAEFLERRERGESLEAAQFAREHGDAGEELLGALQLVVDAERRLDAAGAVEGRQFGPYRVVGELGRGAMGRVLRVVDSRGGARELALKVLDGGHALSSRARERFAREANTLRALAHPNVVRVLDSDTDAGLPWLVMELVEGRTLAELIAQARASGAADALPTPRAARLALQLARAVEAVHAAGALHRDIKPSNAILRDDDTLVLVDFGLVHDEAARTLTRTGDLVGTPQYMAPEQARGERADERTDVWGVGAVLYELLGLRPPNGDGAPLEVLTRLRTQPVVDLLSIAPKTPRDLARVVMRALAPRRARRTQSAALLAADLQAFVEGREVRARGTGSVERLENLWQFRRGALAAVGAFLLLAAITWQTVERGRRAAREREDARMGQLIDEWLDGNSVAVERDALALAASTQHADWAELLAASSSQREPRASAVDSVTHAAAGWRAVEARRYDEGIAELQTARELATGSTAPIVMLARAAQRAGKFELAAREYRAVSERLPTSSEAYASLSDVHYARKDDAEAEREIRRALELAPLDADHYFDLSRIVGRAKRASESAEAALRGQELAGEQVTSKQLEILAGALDQNGRYEEARAVFQRLIDRDPNDWSAHYNFAYSFLLDHHLIEARDALLALLELGQRERGEALLAWLYAGCNYETCAERRAAYAAHPELRDADAAERCALASLTKAERNEVPGLAATVAVLIDRRDAIRARLEELQAAEQDDRRIAVLERALRVVREPKQ